MRTCKVLVHGIEAGVLTERDAHPKYVFQYNSEYIKDNKTQVCLAMPLQEEPYLSDVLFPFFFNMLSEGDNRAMQSSLLHIDKDDDFGILLATAQHDTIGAVTVLPIND